MPARTKREGDDDDDEELGSLSKHQGNTATFVFLKKLLLLIPTCYIAVASQFSAENQQKCSKLSWHLLVDEMLGVA